MKEKRFTRNDLVQMGCRQFETLSLALRTGAWGLLGIQYEKRIEAIIDPLTGDLVFRYE